MSDRLLVSILPDGTIRTETGAIGTVNHSSADSFLRDVSILTGGPVTRTARTGAPAGVQVGTTEKAG